ncbi:uncharacterized protein B0I36DRAFT_243826 [Microdochium trichocladiopsis]|uniref:Uncharacterized protein n=1 Tax=Microdochium trichocladiopsis TaxID=1682393 RepID=A0A9P8Y9A5_9PEZI|nr:uncharacterized protein B0I36DRAFT_243826 [Microdochium trichocladiopsis]KAH7031311.1 hypothetical protein B0I36DRAFT_243826 [Microdochium trichocladiopsis]
MDSEGPLATGPPAAESHRRKPSGASFPQPPSLQFSSLPSQRSDSDSSGLQLSSGPSSPSLARVPPRHSTSQKEDLSPSTSLCARSSVETYSSLASVQDLADSDSQDALDFEDVDIPELPPYHHDIEEFNVRPSSPNEFAALFPSLDRFSIRHDDFTSDGNMNLRVETKITGRHNETIQLFHLRMYDLNKRDFSLRRYCRSSGREVCNSKRRYLDTTNTSRPTLQRSMSNAFSSLAGRPRARRQSTAASIRSTKSTKSRPGTGYSTSGSLGSGFVDVFDEDLSVEKKPNARMQPTNTIKLEFSNYARVDLERVGSRTSSKWQYEWWGVKYAWKRVVDKHTNAVSFHLVRNGNKAAPIAHIVAETRAPNQVMVDEYAGGWVPPCHMWISDPSIVDAATDVADVIVSTGLLALVDDCIRNRWQSKKPSHFDLPHAGNTRSFVQNLFSRRPSETPPSPLRFQRATAAP